MIAFSIYSVSNFQICNIVLLTLVTSLCIILLRTAAGWASLSFTISRSLLRLMPIDLVMPSNHLILCCPLLLLPSASGSFPVNSLFASGGQSIEASASTSVLPMSTQDWSPLGWTGWISLHFRGSDKNSRKRLITFITRFLKNRLVTPFSLLLCLHRTSLARLAS